MLADMVRTDSHQLRTVAGDSAGAQAIKVVTRMHKTLIWERTRTGQRLRHALRDYFPAALVAFEDLDAPDTLELLAKAPDPASAARLSTAQISAALKRARRRGIGDKTARIQAALRTEHLAQPAVVTQAYAASTRALAAVLVVLNEQTRCLAPHPAWSQVVDDFHQEVRHGYGLLSVAMSGRVAVRRTWVRRTGSS